VVTNPHSRFPIPYSRISYEGINTLNFYFNNTIPDYNWGRTLPEEELDYENISQLFQKERKVSRLTEISQEFYNEIIRYIKNLQTEYSKEFKKNPTSPTTLLLREEHLKTLKLLKRIYEIRERKVILFALNKVKGSAHEVKNITHQEEQLLEEIIEVLNRYRAPVLNITGQTGAAVSDGKKTQSEPSEPTRDFQDDNESQQPEQSLEMVKNNDESGKTELEQIPDSVVALVLEDISSFVGTDLRTYTLQREDVVALPKDVASILVKNNKVKLLEM
jgi:DNA replication initiation complex subunit (GINS family)